MTPGRIQKKFLSRGLGSQLELVATGQTWDTVTISKRINLKCIHHIYTEKRKKANKQEIKLQWSPLENATRELTVLKR